MVDDKLNLLKNRRFYLVLPISLGKKKIFHPVVFYLLLAIDKPLPDLCVSSVTKAWPAQQINGRIPFTGVEITWAPDWRVPGAP